MISKLECQSPEFIQQRVAGGCTKKNCLLHMTIKTAANRHSGSVNMEVFKKYYSRQLARCVSVKSFPRMKHRGRDWNSSPVEEKIHRLLTMIIPVIILKKLLLPFSTDLK